MSQDGSLPAEGAKAIKYWPALYVFMVFLTFGLAFWLIQGETVPLIFLSAIGLFVSAGYVIHTAARPKRKRLGHRLSLALVGLFLFLGAGVFGRQSFQIEGFFFYLFAGVLGGVVVHYIVAKLIGPLFFGRAWCSWGCWTWMALQYLPYRRSPHRPRSRWSWLRSAHFLAALALVLTLRFGFHYDHGTEWQTTKGLSWFLAGNLFYYSSGVILALALADNRAFCKYLCPITVMLRLSSRLSLLKVAGDRGRCKQCGACDKVCPMDVAVSAYIQSGKRVLDPECTLCQTCITACPTASLSLSLGLDLPRPGKSP